MSDRDFVPVLPNGENGDESEWLKIRSFIPYPPNPLSPLRWRKGEQDSPMRSDCVAERAAEAAMAQWAKLPFVPFG
jgi:hypothetical protein